MPLRSISKPIEAGSAPAGSIASCVKVTLACVSPSRTITGIDAPTSAVSVTPILLASLAASMLPLPTGSATRSICRCERYSPVARSSGLRRSMRTVCEAPGAIVTWRGEKRTISSAKCSPGAAVSAGEKSPVSFMRRLTMLKR